MEFIPYTEQDEHEDRAKKLKELESEIAKLSVTYSSLNELVQTQQEDLTDAQIQITSSNQTVQKGESEVASAGFALGARRRWIGAASLVVGTLSELVMPGTGIVLGVITGVCASKI